MTKRALLYDPPMGGAEDMAHARKVSMASSDLEVSFDIGHFFIWYAAAEFLLTMVLHAFFKSYPLDFHTITKGLDAKAKIDRLYNLCDNRSIVISPDLDARLDHFKSVITGLRNKLAHNFIYQPEGQPIQVCSLGAPPEFGRDDLGFPAPPPDIIDPVDLFERAIWLQAFAKDLAELHLSLAERGSLQKGVWHSGLPKGSSPRSPRKARTPTRRTHRTQQPQQPRG